MSDEERAREIVREHFSQWETTTALRERIAAALAAARAEALEECARYISRSAGESPTLQRMACEIRALATDKKAR